MRILTLSSLLLILGIMSCKTTNGASSGKKDKSKYNLELLYKVWDVESITTGGQTATGEAMGNPQYEFTKDGKRIKSYKVPAHSESTEYIVRNDSIIYTTNTKLPASAITTLTDTTLHLSNDKAEWKLYIKK